MSSTEENEAVDQSPHASKRAKVDDNSTSSTDKPSLYSLPFDVFDMIFADLDAATILAVALSCKQLTHLLKYNKFWWRAYLGTTRLNYRERGYYYDLPPNYASHWTYDDWDDVEDARCGEIWDNPLVYCVGIYQQQLLNGNDIERQVMRQTGLPTDPAGDKYAIAAFADGDVPHETMPEYDSNTDWRELFYQQWHIYQCSIVNSQAVCPFPYTALTRWLCYCDIMALLKLGGAVDVEYISRSFYPVVPKHDFQLTEDEQTDLAYLRMISARIARAREPNSGKSDDTSDGEYESFTEDDIVDVEEALDQTVEALGSESDSFVSVFALCLSALQAEHAPDLSCPDWLSIRLFRMQHGEKSLPAGIILGIADQIKYARALWHRRCLGKRWSPNGHHNLPPEELAQFVSFDSVVTPNGLGAMAVRSVLCALHKLNCEQLQWLRDKFQKRFPVQSVAVNCYASGDAIPDIRCGLVQMQPWIYSFFASSLPAITQKNTLSKEFPQSETLDDNPDMDAITWHRTMHALFRRVGILEAAPSACETAVDVLRDFIRSTLKRAIAYSALRRGIISTKEELQTTELPDAIDIEAQDILLALATANPRTDGTSRMILYTTSLYDIPHASLAICSRSPHYVCDSDEEDEEMEEDELLESNSDEESSCVVTLHSELQNELIGISMDLRDKFAPNEPPMSVFAPGRLSLWQQCDANPAPDDGFWSYSDGSEDGLEDDEDSYEDELALACNSYDDPTKLNPDPPVVHNVFAEKCLQAELVYYGHGDKLESIKDSNEPVITLIREHKLNGVDEEKDPHYEWRKAVGEATNRKILESYAKDIHNHASRLFTATTDPFGEYDEFMDLIANNERGDEETNHLIVFPGVTANTVSRALTKLATSIATNTTIEVLEIVSAEDHSPKAFAELVKVLAKGLCSVREVIFNSCVLTTENLIALQEVLESPQTKLNAIALESCCFDDNARITLHEMKDSSTSQFYMLKLPHRVEFTRRKTPPK